MTTTAVAVKDEQRIARPLKVLVPLIHEDLRLGKEGSAKAGLPHYQDAGEKLLEAKSQLQHGEFVEWVKRHFTEIKLSPVRRSSGVGGTRTTAILP